MIVVKFIKYPTEASAAAPSASSAGLPSRGIHWHPVLEISIKGQRVVIPANTGIGPQYSGSRFFDSMMQMTNMHTHDTSGRLHWEVMHPPAAEDLYLGNFFEVWGKSFDGTCILEYCNVPEGTVKLLVNGESNGDLERYVVRDGDRISIVYE